MSSSDPADAVPATTTTATAMAIARMSTSILLFGISRTGGTRHCGPTPFPGLLAELQSRPLLRERPQACGRLPHSNERGFPDLFLTGSGLLRDREAILRSSKSAGHERARVRQQSVGLLVE